MTGRCETCETCEMCDGEEGESEVWQPVRVADCCWAVVLQD